jgi:hypothetical protein
MTGQTCVHTPSTLAQSGPAVSSGDTVQLPGDDWIDRLRALQTAQVTDNIFPINMLHCITSSWTARRSVDVWTERERRLQSDT